MSRRKQARPKSCKSESPGCDDKSSAQTTDQRGSLDEEMLTETPVCDSKSAAQPNDDRGDLDKEMLDTSENWPLSRTGPDVPASPCDSQSCSSTDTLPDSSWTDLQELESLEADKVPFVVGVREDYSHSCQHCEKAFLTKGHRDLHEQSHKAHMPYKCRHCPRLFRHRKSKDRHDKLHSSDRKYKCATCGLSYSRSDHLRNHIKSHSSMDREEEEEYKCPICQRNYTSASALMNHLNSHQPNGPEESGDISCFECQQKFSTAEDLKKHMLTHANEDLVKTERFECEICQEVFFVQEQLSSHIEQRHGDDQSLKCPICFNAFKDKQQLCHHIMSHNLADEQQAHCSEITTSLRDRPNPFSTTENKENFSFDKGDNHHSEPSVRSLVLSAPSSATNSGVATSSAADILVCPYCLAEGFETLESLELHLTSVHSVKPTEVYTCNYCNAPYPNLYSLHDHMTVVHRSQHGLDITYPCSLCVQRFHSLDALAKHKGIVHSQYRSSGIDAAFCNRCNMTLISPHSLEDHMATVHNIIMNKSPRSFKTRNKKFNKVSRDKEKTFNSSSSSPGAFRTALKGDGSSETTQTEAEQEGILGFEVQPSHKSKSSKTTTHLARKSLPERNVTLQNICGSSSVLNHSILSCNLCGATFHDTQNFAAHASLHEAHNSVSGGRSLHTEDLFMVRSNILETTTSKSETDSLLATKQEKDVFKKHNCLKCGASFTSEEHLEAHASLHYLCVSTEYGCSSCIKNFSKPDELQKHLMDIHAHHLYRCSLCKDIFDSKVNIQVHFAIKHSNECKIYKCVSCDIMFQSEVEWQVHVRVSHLHMSRPYRCLFCQKSFTSEVELQCHLTTHSKQFTCSRCDQAFHMEHLLDQHKLNCKLQDNLKQTSSSQRFPVCSSSSPFRNLTIKQEKEEQFLPLSHSMTTPPSSSSFTSLDLLQSPGGVSTGKQPVSLSPLATPTLSSMTTPISTVWKNTEPLHICNICDVKFCDLDLLNLHKAQDHGLKAVLKLNYSESEFLIKNEHDKLMLNNQALLSALSAPTSPVSASMPPISPSSTSILPQQQQQQQLSCMFCSQTFKTSLEYNKHMKIHVNSGNLTCSICDETFISASVLAEHKLTHCKIQQGNTCVICRVTLGSQEQFYMHAQDHGFEGSLLQCVVCRQTLSSMVELQMHGRHHFQTRPSFFTCCVCLKSFESRENLVSKLNSSGRTYYVCKPCYHGEAPLHTCSHCSEKFATAHLLEAHLQTHKSLFQCIKCQQSFSSEYDIQLHVTTHMLTEGTQHECRLCGAFFDSPARLQTHLIQHSFLGQEITCFVCNKIFESPQEIQVHALEHGSSFRKFNCLFCSQKFFFTAELDNHKLIYNHHGINSLTASSTSPAAASSFHLSSASLSVATIASLFSSPTTVKSQELISVSSQANKKIVEDFTLPLYASVCPQLPASSSQSNVLSPISGSGQDTLTVPCLVSLAYSSSASSHNLQCPECQKYFSTGTALANHRKTHWKKDPSSTIRCSLCSLTFNSATSMQQHFFAVHSNKEDESKRKKTFKCMMCEKECSTLSALQNHILSHRTGSSLPCSVCKKTFTSQRYLNLHMRVHKPAEKKPDGVSTDEAPYSRLSNQEPKLNQSVLEEEKRLVLSCPVCELSFQSSQEIETHIKTHEEVFTTLGSVTDSMELSILDQADQSNDEICILKVDER